MPSLTIAALFREVFPKHAFLVSGHGNITFSWVRVITSEAEASEKVAPGELVLISRQVFENESDPKRTLNQVIARLIQARVPAFCIQGGINVDILEDALRQGLAVIYLPDEVSLDSIERLALRMLTDQQAMLSRYESDLQGAISRPGGNYQNLAGLMQALAGLLNRPVALHDAHNLRLAYAFPEGPVAPGVRWRQHLALLDDDKIENQTQLQPSTAIDGLDAYENDQLLRLTLSVDSDPVGYLSVVKNDRDFDEIDPLIIKRAASLAMQQLNKYYTAILPDDYATSWVANWLDNPPNNDVLLTARAEQQAGFDSEQTYVVMVMRYLPNGKTSRTPLTPAQFTEYVSNETRTRRINAIVGQYVDRTLMFLPLEKAQHTGRMKQYAENICARLADQLNCIVVGGVGRPGLGLTELRSSFAEAERAQVLADQLWDGTQTRFFGDLRLNELLMSIRDIERLRRFYSDWLADILEYDQESRSDLLLTTGAYFANNGNMAATAKQLNVHRNTLVYRLNRIAEITQLDMDDADVQLNLHVAIKAYRLLQNLGLV